MHNQPSLLFFSLSFSLLPTSYFSFSLANTSYNLTNLSILIWTHQTQNLSFPTLTIFALKYCGCNCGHNTNYSLLNISSSLTNFTHSMYLLLSLFVLIVTCFWRTNLIINLFVLIKHTMINSSCNTFGYVLLWFSCFNSCTWNISTPFDVIAQSLLYCVCMGVLTNRELFLKILQNLSQKPEGRSGAEGEGSHTGSGADNEA